MDDLPGFLGSFNVVKQESPGQATQDSFSASAPPPKGKAFTARDHEVVQAILKSAKFSHQMTDIEVSNATLGKTLGMTNGAVSARIKRLGQFGILHVVHFNATDTGENNRRVIHVVKQPPSPFKPWEPRS